MPPATALTSLGMQMRRARERAGLTLDALAKATGMSKAHLSRIESGERQPAVATLLSLASALDVRVATLLGEDEEGASLAIHLPGTQSQEVNGLQVTPVSGFRGARDLEALHVRISVDRVASELASHAGEEWLHVLTGTVLLEHAGDLHVLSQGSSAHFDALKPHRLTALHGDAEALLVASASPRAFSQLHP